MQVRVCENPEEYGSIFTRFIQYAAISIATLLVVEVFAQLWVRQQTGEFLFNRKINAVQSNDEADADTRQKLSPIFGYSLRPGWAASDHIRDLPALLEQIGEERLPDHFSIPGNNYGFVSRHDYPFHSDAPKPFYVSVLGGSVANGFAQISNKLIIDAVRDSPGFGDRDVVVLNMAMGGFKQPQQVQVLGYFLSIGQKVDLIINMDGLNEAYIGWINEKLFDVEYSLPHGGFLNGLLNNFVSKQQTAQPERFTRVADSTRIALVYLYADALRFREDVRKIEIESESGLAVAGRQYPMTIQKPEPVGLAELSDQIVETWARGSLTLKGMADGFGIPYIHALQPNQYHSEKDFSEAERLVAFGEQEWRGAEMVRLTYPKFVEAGRTLAEKGVNYLDLTTAFRGVKEHLYTDNCCHFRRRGYEIIMDTHMNAAINRALTSGSQD